MDASSARMLALLALSGAAAAALLPGGPLRVPTSPEGMIADAARCVAAARDAGQRRLLVRIVVPQLDTVQPEDLDPWPGGLAQQYPYALDLARRLLCATVGCAPSQVRDSVVSAEDACGLLLAEGAVPADDAACLLFPGPDQLDQLAQTEAMVGESRLLLLLNPQWRRPSDFARADRARADQLFFNRGYEVGYTFDELACRGEDVKLVGGSIPGWLASVFLNDNDLTGTPLHDEPSLRERPDYAWLAAAINRRHPAPRWARKLDEADALGPAFLRKGQGGSGS